MTLVSVFSRLHGQLILKVSIHHLPSFSMMLAASASLGLLSTASDAMALSSEEMIQKAEAACLEAAAAEGWNSKAAKIISTRVIDSDKVEVVFDLTKEALLLDGVNSARLTCPYSISYGVGALGDTVSPSGGRARQSSSRTGGRARQSSGSRYPQWLTLNDPRYPSYKIDYNSIRVDNRGIRSVDTSIMIGGRLYPSVSHVDCNHWKSTFTASDGSTAPWSVISPGTVSEGVAYIVCPGSRQQEFIKRAKALSVQDLYNPNDAWNSPLPERPTIEPLGPLPQPRYVSPFVPGYYR